MKRNDADPFEHTVKELQLIRAEHVRSLMAQREEQSEMIGLKREQWEKERRTLVAQINQLTEENKQLKNRVQSSGRSNSEVVVVISPDRNDKLPQDLSSTALDETIVDEDRQVHIINSIDFASVSSPDRGGSSVQQQQQKQRGGSMQSEDDVETYL